MSEFQIFCNQQILLLSGSFKSVQGQVTTVKMIVASFLNCFLILSGSNSVGVPFVHCLEYSSGNTKLIVKTFDCYPMAGDD